MNSPKFCHAPALRDGQTGLSLGVEPNGSFGSPALVNLLRDTERNRDINGRDIGQVVDRTGWQFTGRPALACAYDESGLVVAASWCTPIQRNGYGDRRGFNLSYATAPKWCGHGLGRLLSALAFDALKIDLSRYDGWFMNIQCDSTNLASQRVALGLGFVPAPMDNFSVPGLGRSYLAFSSPVKLFNFVAQDLVRARVIPNPFWSESIESDQLPECPGPGSSA